MREQLEMEDALLDKVDSVDGDVEDYVRRLQRILGDKMALLQKLQGLVCDVGKL